ncbi:MAG: sigma-70 family RNA polymerase sigma factor [Flavobacteriales bacterium]|nr:sigma-70 family RNA polymerase sigma factor [Flavobacteriales bacterium]
MLKDDFQREVFSHRHKMYRFAMSFLKNEEEAKDIVQEVLMKLWETKNELSEIKNLEAWCMTLTRNKSLDALKRSGKRLNDRLDVHHEPAHSTSDTPLDIVAEKESIANVKKLADKLPEKQKTAFTLREIQGYSYLEICDIMSISMSQCKVNIFRARNTLKEELTKQYSYE